MNEKLTLHAQEFTARWGFLTRDLFFEFFCAMSQAQQYRYWEHLTAQGLFYPSKTNPQVLLLTQRGRAQFRDMARPARLPAYVAHDALVARVFLVLDQRGLIAKSWLEDELIRSPIEAYHILGADKVHRVPDLIFDLRTAGGGIVRCALEIEKTVKSQTKYAKMALAYLGYSKVDMILFGCGSASTEAAVRNAFNGTNFKEKSRIPGIFQFDEVDPVNLQTPIRFQEREFALQSFLEIVTKLPVRQMNSIGERNENRFSFRNSSKAEVG